MAKMQKRRTIHPHHHTETKPLTIETRCARYPDPNPAHARRLRHHMMREYGNALKLRGAVKMSRLKKLAKLASQIDGMTGFIHEDGTVTIRKG
jgi:hypothetical protein